MSSNRAGTPFSGKSDPFVKGPWKFMSVKSHILKSEESEKLISDLGLPQLPEMTFGNNKLVITHLNGFGIEFNAIDALRLVDTKNDLMKVSMAKEWKDSREGSEYISRTVKPFDWTFTTNYNGSVSDAENHLKISETEKRINIELLKKREPILFFDEIMLFEDELADNGCAQLNVKFRAMPSCFFLLMRFFLRVDGVLSRIYDTRLYHEFGTDYMIREYTEKEKSFSEIRNVPPHVLTDSNLLDRYLSLKCRTVEELQFKSHQHENTNNNSSSGVNPTPLDINKSIPKDLGTDS